MVGPSLCLLLLLSCWVASIDSFSSSGPRPERTWTNQGGDAQNSGSALHRNVNANDLDLREPTVKWDLGSSIIGTPVTDGVLVYVSTADGHIAALDPRTKDIRWKKNIFEEYYFSIIPIYASATLPLAVASTLVIHEGHLVAGMGGPADLLLIKKINGDLIKKVNLDPHPTAIIEQSGVVHKGVYLVGVSSLEEVLAHSEKDYACCSFSGSFHALEMTNLAPVWSQPFYSIPPSMTGPSSFPGRGWSGGKIWTSSPAIDPRTEVVYFTTGDAYTSPPAFRDCVHYQLSINESDVDANCFVPMANDVHVGSVMGLKISDGSIYAKRRIISRDAHFLVCNPVIGFFPDNPYCGSFPPGAQANFDSSPALDFVHFCGYCDSLSLSPEFRSRAVSGFCVDLTTQSYRKTDSCLKMGTNNKDWSGPYDQKVRMLDPNTDPILYVRQTNGYLHALRAFDLYPIWVNIIGPGGTSGTNPDVRGGMGYDNDKIYTGIQNPNHRLWYLFGGNTTKCGGVSAISKFTGEVDWTFVLPTCQDLTGGPDSETDVHHTNGRAYSSSVYGAISVLDGGILFGSPSVAFDGPNPTYGSGGEVYLLESGQGDIISQGETKGSIVGGFSVSSTCVFVGQGYGNGESYDFSTGKDVFGYCADTPN